MARTFEELDLLAELERIRRAARPGTLQPISPDQAVRIGTVDSPAAAIRALVVTMISVFRKLESGPLPPDHPAVRAFVILLHHADADRSLLRLLPEAHRKSIEEALARDTTVWDPDQLEWQLVQYVKMGAGDVALEPRLTLPMQNLPTKSLQFAWAVLMDLAVLRGADLLR